MGLSVCFKQYLETFPSKRIGIGHFLILALFFMRHSLNLGYLAHRSFLKSASNNKKRSHTQLDSRKQVIAFQDRVITINIKEAQHPLK